MILRINLFSPITYSTLFIQTYCLQSFKTHCFYAASMFLYACDLFCELCIVMLSLSPSVVLILGLVRVDVIYWGHRLVR